MIVYASHPSPIGELLLVGEPDASGGVRLGGIFMEGHRHGPSVDPSWSADPAAFREVGRQIDQYFARSRATFDLALTPAGTLFQQRVWAELGQIASGTTVTYGELARRVGRPGAARAVGAAVGRNPISIVVPCHRVVGSDGSLTGYAGGVARKAFLLALEGAATGVPSATEEPAPTVVAAATVVAP